MSPSSCKPFIFTCIQFISVLTASANDLFKISTPHPPHPVKKIMVHPWRVYRTGSRVTSPAATQASFSANHWEVKPEPITSLLRPYLFLAWRWIHSSVLICDWVVSLFFEQKAVAFIRWRSFKKRSKSILYTMSRYSYSPLLLRNRALSGRDKDETWGRGTRRACWCWTVDRKVLDHFLNASDIFSIF